MITFRAMTQDKEVMKGALAQLEAQTFTQEQKGFLSGIMTTWDQLDGLDTKMEAKLRKMFDGQYSIIAPLTQIVQIAERYGNNEAMDAEFKKMISKTVKSLNTDASASASNDCNHSIKVSIKFNR